MSQSNHSARERVLSLRDHAFSQLGARDGLVWLCTPHRMLLGVPPIAAAWMDAVLASYAHALLE